METVSRHLVRLVGQLSPRAAARLWWARERRMDLALRVVDELVQRGDEVVDAGASWGLFCARFADLVGREGRVYAFEPNPAVSRSLERMRAGRARVTIHRVALSDWSGEAELRVPIVGGRPVAELASLAGPRTAEEGEHERVTVPVERIDALLPEDARIAFFKCDVEGHELAVLRGAEAALRGSRPALLVEIEERHSGDPGSTFDYLLGLGYVGYFLTPAGLLPLERFDVERDQRAHLLEGNETTVPRDYVRDFLFVSPETSVARLLAPSRRRT